MTDRRAESSFQAFEPLLWRVLGSLARSGFVAPPLDSRDVIHDFYVEAWDGVKSRYDEQVSDFRTYLSSSFYKFARRRIVALHGWRHRLVDIELFVDQLVDYKTPQRIVEQRQLVAAIGVALSKLPYDERVVLNEYLQDSEPSERTIAIRHSLSRYALRERLYNALGRVAVEMGRLDGKRTESLVAFYLWGEGRSAQNVSQLLGISVVNVRRCKSDFASQLLLALRRPQSPHSKLQIGGTMSSSKLLKTTLLTPNDRVLLDRLKSTYRLREQLITDEEDLSFTADESEVLERNAEWVASVYDAIGGDLDENDDENTKTLAYALVKIRQDSESEIGEAFVNLLERLEGAEFSDWKRYFGKLKSVSSNEQAIRMESPSFVDGIPNASLLASYGITPLMFHDCIRGLELLFDRLLDSHAKFAQSNLEASFPDVELSHEQHSVLVPGGLVVDQLATTPGMRPDAVRGMALWLSDVTLRVPLLVRGYEATWRQGRLQVTQRFDEEIRSSRFDDIVSRWTQVSVTA